MGAGDRVRSSPTRPPGPKEDGPGLRGAKVELPCVLSSSFAFFAGGWHKTIDSPLFGDSRYRGRRLCGGADIVADVSSQFNLNNIKLLSSYTKNLSPGVFYFLGQLSQASRVTRPLGSRGLAMLARRIQEWRKRAKGVEIHPISQEGRHGGGKQGRASLNYSPDSCGIHSLIGAIDTSLLRWSFSA